MDKAHKPILTKSGYLKPRMTVEQSEKTLTYHTGSTNNTYIILFHITAPPNYMFFSCYIVSLKKNTG